MDEEIISMTIVDIARIITNFGFLLMQAFLYFKIYQLINAVIEFLQNYNAPCG